MIIVSAQFERFAIERHHVNVSIQNRLATTQTDQVFANPNAVPVEGDYIFPIPVGTEVSDFTLRVDGSVVKAARLPRADAQRVLRRIVHASGDETLMEYVGRDFFYVQLPPIPSGDTRRVQLHYAQILKQTGERTKYLCPLKTEQPIGSLAVSIELKSSHPLKSLYCPSHEVAVTRKDEHRARVSYTETDAIAVDTDFEFYYSVSDEEFGIDLYTHRENQKEDGYFMLNLSPRYEVNQTSVIEKDFIFVLDRSGSMRGKKIAQAKEALRFCMRNLNDGDRFNLIRFDDEIEAFSDNLVPVTQQRDNALAFINHIEGRGMTNINGALLTALADAPDAKRPRIIIFLTDGHQTAGERRTAHILRNVSTKNERHACIFVFGVGYQVNTELLDNLAEQNGGTRVYVEPHENLEKTLSTFFANINDPVLVNLGLTMEGIRTNSVYPIELPDMFRGSEVTVLGRYEVAGGASQQVQLKLTGEIDGELHEFVKTVQFPAAQIEQDFLPRLWAQRRMAYLENELILHGANEELSDELIRVGEAYGIVTPYLSRIVSDDSVLGGQHRHMERDLAFHGTSDYERRVKASKYAAASRERRFMAPRLDTVRRIGGKTFHLDGDWWVDKEYHHYPGTDVKDIAFHSNEYFELTDAFPALARYLAAGKNVIVCHEGTVYRIKSSSN